MIPEHPNFISLWKRMTNHFLKKIFPVSRLESVYANRDTIRLVVLSPVVLDSMDKTVWRSAKVAPEVVIPRQGSVLAPALPADGVPIVINVSPLIL